MDREDAVIGCGMVVLFAGLLLGLGVWNWYRAGVQQEVYAREGVRMSQWEVFIGAKPGDRTVNVREAK